MSTEKVCCPSCHHYGNNQHERDQVSYRCGRCGTTWPRVDMLDDTQYCPMCEEAGKQLEAAKQHNLELLAVIEKMQGLWVACGHDPIEPSQALREHEAEVLDDASAYFDGNLHYSGGIAEKLRRMAEERRKK